MRSGHPCGGGAETTIEVQAAIVVVEAAVEVQAAVVVVKATIEAGQQ